MKTVTINTLQDLKAKGRKFPVITCYDASFAKLVEQAEIDVMLVGDSLGMVCQGLASTAGVTLETMAYHVESVARGLRRVQGTAWLLGDLPFGSYHESKEQAMRSAAQLVHAGAHMIKLEGGGWTAETTRFLVERGIPVCAHLGLTPQTVHALGGYRVQGRGDAAALTLKRHALELQDAGATTAGEEATTEESADKAETQEAPEADAAAAGEEEAWRDKYLRLYAEFDNFRKRTMRERADLVRSAGRDLTEAMLPVLDDFERAAAAEQEPDQLKEGYKLIGQKMRGILEARGLQRMEAKGAEFDIDLHEAIAQVPAPEADMKGKVIDVEVSPAD